MLDGLLLTRGSVHNLERSGAGNLTLTNCATTCCSGGTLYDGNNSGSANRGLGGGGFCLSGSGVSELLVVDSEISGNQAGGEWVASGCGGWMSGFKSATFEGTLFATNSHNSGRNGCFGGILQANGVPIAFRRCAFRGNYSAGGDLLHLNGNCGGTVFENCIFAGNSGSSNNSGGKGVVDVALGAMESAVCFRNCTFAYNVCGNAGALYVEKGTAAVTNSVFFGNVTHRSVTKGADITLNAPGCADIARTLFAEGEFTNYVSSVSNEHVTVSEVLRGDPQFVTSAEDFKAAYKVSDLPRSNSTFPKHAVAMSPNLHLRGGSGYVDEMTGEKVKTWARSRWASPAIDAGDPAVRCAEPKPNGHRVNLGAYGNTPWATMSPAGTALIVR